MVEIRIEGTKAVFTVQGWDKLWALRSQLEISLAHINEVHTDASPKMGWFEGLKVQVRTSPMFSGQARSTRTAAGCSGTCCTQTK